MPREQDAAVLERFTKEHAVGGREPPRGRVGADESFTLYAEHVERAWERPSRTGLIRLSGTDPTTATSSDSTMFLAVETTEPERPT